MLRDGKVGTRMTPLAMVTMNGDLEDEVEVDSRFALLAPQTTRLSRVHML